MLLFFMITDQCQSAMQKREYRRIYKEGSCYTKYTQKLESITLMKALGTMNAILGSQYASTQRCNK